MVPAPSTATFSIVIDMVNKTSIEGCDVLIHNPEVGETSQHDENVKNFMKAKNLGNGVWFFKSVDNSANSVEKSPNHNPDNGAYFKCFDERPAGHNNSPSHKEIGGD